ncbi:MAG: hypothetical protein FWC60_03490, partial [Firmicutes bacterium]|nr:hypothetical protein [Bacillota bacterium]
MRFNKISKKLFALVLTVIMMFPSLLTVFAAGTPGTFPLIATDGAMLADTNTKYVTILEQNPVTKLITASVVIQNNSTGAGAQEVVVATLGLDLSFTDKVTPYAYDPTNPPSQFDPSRMYTGPSVTTEASFRKYFYAPVSGFNTLSIPVVSNDANKRIIAAQLSANNASSYLMVAPGESKVVAQF